MDSPSMIQLRDIRKSFPVGPTQIDVLHGIDLEIARGDLAAVVGASGSGKSTLMSILGLLDAPTSGSFRLEGREVSRLDDDAVSDLRSKCIGFVFQSFQLLQRLDAADNVALPMIYGGTPDAQARTRALDPRVGREILDLFVELNQTQRITVVMITHDPGCAAACRRVFEMRDGRLAPEQTGQDYGAQHEANKPTSKDSSP